MNTLLSFILGIVTVFSGYSVYHQQAPIETINQLGSSMTSSVWLVSSGLPKWFGTVSDGCAEWSGNVLTTTGSDCGGGGGLHVDGTGFVYPQTGDYHSAPKYIATSTTAASTFVLASSTNLTVTGSLWANLTGNADTATALSANGANCSAGNAPLGVDASGAVESCFDVWTEAENTSAAYISLTDLSASFPISYNSGSGAFTWSGLATTTTWTNGAIATVVNGNTLTSSSTISQAYIDSAIARDSELHDAVTLAGEDFLSLSTQQITANAINPDNLSASDFGDFTCNGTTCSLDVAVSSLHVDGTGFVYPQTGDYHSAPKYVATSTSAASTFNLASTTLLTVTSDLYVADHIYHDGDPDTYQLWGTNQLQYVIGGLGLMLFNSSAPNNDYIHLNAFNDNANVRIDGDTNDYLALFDASTERLGIGTSTPAASLVVEGDSGETLLELAASAGTKLLTMLDSGVTTILGAWDFGGATSLEIPNATNPTVDAEGEIAINTSTTSIRFYEGSSEFQLKPEFPLFGATFASSSLSYDGSFGNSGTTTEIRAGFKYGVTVTELYCKTDTSSAYWAIGDGTSTTTLNCTTSGTTNSSPSLSFTGRENIYNDFGTTTTSVPNKIYTDVTGRWTTD